jgi:hypothetical protein
MRFQGAAIQCESRGGHHAIEVEKGTMRRWRVRCFEVTAIEPDVLPCGGIPLLPGEWGDTVGQGDAGKMGVVEEGIERAGVRGRGVELSAKEPVAIQ